MWLRSVIGQAICGGRSIVSRRSFSSSKSNVSKKKNISTLEDDQLSWETLKSIEYWGYAASGALISYIAWDFAAARDARRELEDMERANAQTDLKK